MPAKSASPTTRVQLSRFDRWMSHWMGQNYGIEGPSVLFPQLLARARKRPWVSRSELWMTLPVLLLPVLERRILSIPRLTANSFTALVWGVFLLLLFWIGAVAYRTVRSMKDTGQLQELLVTPLGTNQVIFDIHLLILKRAALPFGTYALTAVYLQYVRRYLYVGSLHLYIFLPMIMWGASDIGARIALQLIGFHSIGEAFLAFWKLLIAFLLFLLLLTKRVVLWIALPLAVIVPLIMLAARHSPELGWVTGILLGTAALVLACVGLLHVSNKDYEKADEAMQRIDKGPKGPDYGAIDL